VANGVQSVVGFNYRNAPGGRTGAGAHRRRPAGQIHQVSITLLADYAAHPEGALSWRFINAWAGSGVLGDLVSHGIDLARYLVDEITDVVADDATFITQRPRVDGAASHFSRSSGGTLGPVENEDYVGALSRFAGGARGTLQSSRASVGDQCTYGVEVHVERGALAWDFRRMGELRTCLDQDYQNASYATQFVAPGSGDLAYFQPGTGIAIAMTT